MQGFSAFLHNRDQETKISQFRPHTVIIRKNILPILNIIDFGRNPGYQ